MIDNRLLNGSDNRKSLNLNALSISIIIGYDVIFENVINIRLYNNYGRNCQHILFMKEGK